MNNKVSIIVLNWNRWKDTVECLESLYLTSYYDYTIIVVDNGSEDGSIVKIREFCSNKLDSLKYPGKNPVKIFEYEKRESETANKLQKDFYELPSTEKLILIKNDQNYGFAEGNNIGIRFALNKLNTDYILLLNNDTVTDKCFLDELVKVAEKDQKIGFIGPKVYNYEYEGKKNIISFAGGLLNMYNGASIHIGDGEIDCGQYEKIREVDFVEGSCILIKKEVLEKIGLLDPKYHAYWEDNDLCSRGAAANYKSFVNPKSKIWHKVSVSSTNEVKTYYLTRNRLWFMKKYSNLLQYTIFILYFFIFKFWIYLIISWKNKSIQMFLKGIIDGLVRYEKSNPDIIVKIK